MALEMRAQCEKCQTPLRVEDLAFICSYECTFCPACTMAMEQRCPTTKVSWSDDHGPPRR